MPERVVIAVFEDKGTAEHASGRLQGEGFAEGDIAVRPLKDVSPIPRTMAPELETLSLDPFFWLFRTIEGDYAKFIRNGETAVCVRVDLPGRTRRAAEIMTWYGPVKVEVVERSDEGRVLRDLSIPRLFDWRRSKQSIICARFGPRT